MTGFGVGGGALLAHAEGSTAQARNFTGLASLLEQARVSDDCFGPMFFVLNDMYYDALRECQGMATQAAEYLEQVATAVRDTAEAYGETDSANASGLDKVETGVGGLGALNSAGDSTRRGDVEQAAGYGSSGADAYLSASAQVRDPGTPVEAAFATFNARMAQIDAVTSPGQAFVDNGLGFLISIVISPLVNFVLEPALGDPEQMRGTGKGWEGVGDWLERAANREKERAEGTGQAWTGEAGDAFRAEMAEFSQGALALGGDIRGLKALLETGADLFDTFVQVVIDIIQELVIGLIIEWLAALAASWITAGASVGVAGAMTTGQVAMTGSRLGRQVLKLQKKLYELFKELERLMVMLRSGPLRGILDRTRSIGELPFVGRAFNRSNPVLGAAHSFDPTTLATKSGFTIIGKGATGQEALAQRAVSTGLGYLGLGGTTATGTAVFRGTLENVPGAAVEWGANRAYEHAQDPSSAEERQAAQERGFTLDE
ncbi:WXG100 family type VII secretion target [Actinokineospora sp. 24-640]